MLKIEKNIPMPPRPLRIRSTIALLLWATLAATLWTVMAHGQECTSVHCYTIGDNTYCYCY